MQTTIHPIFHPNARLDPRPTDLILASTDHVHFHVHRDRVVTSSTNCFNLLLFLPTDGALVLPEPSAIISIILCLIYNNRPFGFQPSAPTILASFDALRTYGLPLKKYLSPPSQLLAATQAQIVSQPIDFSLEIYARASQDDLFELAKAASPALLSLVLPLTDPAKMHKIHSDYLHKLYALHAKRLNVLRQLLRAPPTAHPFTATCGTVGRNRLMLHWHMQSSAVIQLYEAPKASLDNLRRLLSETNPSITCGDCKAALKVSIDQVAHGWENTETTI
ncbi:hypothetical protein QCA50_004024 [Cerrena zonata]|uniref:BTB domain-containing protein n=1 Tax=Cerrena zonata TaxID=2478898 RepID=A0AAW0GKS5_9APHY